MKVTDMGEFILQVGIIISFKEAMPMDESNFFNGKKRQYTVIYSKGMNASILMEVIYSKGINANILMKTDCVYQLHMIIIWLI